MLKSFIDLQKEQLKVDKAKAEADAAKLELVWTRDFGKHGPFHNHVYRTLSEIDCSQLNSILITNQGLDRA